MAKKPRVLDSWAMMAFFENEPAAEQVEQIIVEAHETGTALMMSVVNVGELWYSIARAHSPADADKIINELRTLKIEFVDATWELTKQAAVFKTKGKIAYADCFAAALAKDRKAELVTGDPEFKQVDGEVKILWV
jgi:predicted nucleic acid-binding protein